MICKGLRGADSPVNVCLLNHDEQLLERPEGQRSPSDPGQREAQSGLTGGGLQRAAF